MIQRAASRPEQFTRIVTLVFVAIALHAEAPCLQQDAAGGTATAVSRHIDSLLASPALSPAHAGVHILALDDSAVLYTYQGSKLFLPASTVKLVTTAAALSILPPESRFVTTLLGVVEHDSTVTGNLYVYGTGDPVFSTGDLDSLVVQLSARGIRRIEGDLVGDLSALDTIRWGAGWMWDDEPGGYMPFLGPLALNRNCVSIAISPARKTGNAARVSIVETDVPVQLSNRTVTSPDSSLPPLRFERDRTTNDIVVSGRVDPLAQPDTTTVSIAMPDLFFLRMLEAKLGAYGISFSGSLRLDTASHGRELARVSHDLTPVLRLINTESDNFAAEQLLRMISRYAGDLPASAPGGIQRILSWLSSIGIDTNRLCIADGSGLSPYNMLSPDQLTHILRHMYRSTSLYHTYLNSLAVAGVDGTLTRRFRGSEAEGHVYAKTGTVTGASGLAGYLLSADGVPLAFAIMTGMYPGKAKPIKQFEEAIVRLLARSRIREN